MLGGGVPPSLSELADLERTGMLCLERKRHSFLRNFLLDERRHTLKTTRKAQLPSFGKNSPRCERCDRVRKIRFSDLSFQASFMEDDGFRNTGSSLDQHTAPF